MIRITHYRDFANTEGPTMIDVTFGRAVSDFFTEFARASVKQPLVGTDNEELCIAAWLNTQPPTTYKYINNSGESDFRNLQDLAWLLRNFVYIHNNPEDTDRLDDALGSAEYRARGRVTVRPTKESFANYQNILRFAISWLLGREIYGVPLDTPDGLAATCLAIESELDGGPKLEDTLAAF